MEHYGFFNGDAEYGQDEFNRYFDNLYESGIAMNTDNSMQYPLSLSANQVSVGVGFAILKGFYHYNDSARTLPFAAGNNPRISRVVIQLDLGLKRTALMVKNGTPAASPQPPALTRDGSYYELSLAQYRVETTGAVSLVKDERTDVSVCGAIRPRNLNDYDAAMKEFQRRFEEWFASIQGEAGRSIFIQADGPGEAVDGSIWIDT